MKRLLQILSTAVVGAVLVGGVAGATGTGSSNNVNASSGSSSNNNKTTVCINATNGTTTTTDSSTCPQGYTSCGSSTTCPSPSCGSSKTCPSVTNSQEQKTAVSASSLPETGSNTLTNSAAILTGAFVAVLGISYIGSVLYRRLALK